MLPSIDWNSFLGKLTAIALGWFRDEGYQGNSALNSLGVEAKDLVQQSVLELIRKAGKYKPKTEDDCFRLTYKILRHKFLDCLKRKSYQLSDSINEETLQNQLKEKLNKKFERLRLVAKGDDKLEEYVEAVDFLRKEKPDFKREDIAYILLCSEYEVTKLQNKLRYRASKKESKKKVERL